MSYRPTVSLVIVSRNRLAGLSRLISALRFQTYANFEVVVVSNYTDKDILNASPYVESIKLIHFDKANISAARNLGIRHSAGEILAFTDDDAIPEPPWIERLVAPFVDPQVGSAGGYVRGRNGIEYQWTALKCDKFGDDHPLEMQENTVTRVFDYDGLYFAKVQGANCAFRRSAVDTVGGFDENIRFFLDETDLGLSLAKAGWSTAVVPLAEVQHGFEESAERSANRVPRTLKNIGASKRYFLQKHAAGEGSASIAALRQQQRNRLVCLMVAGRLEPLKIGELMGTFEQGLQGKYSELDTRVETSCETESTEIRLFSKTNQKREFIACAGNVFFAQKIASKAAELTSQGKCVTVFRFTYTALFHRRYFDARGFWVQSGGLFGKSDRNTRSLLPKRTKQRIIEETKKITTQRPIGSVYLFGFFRDLVIELPKREQHTQFVKRLSRS